MVKSMQYYVGIDLGGTQIKGGIVNSDNVVLYFDKIDTQASLGNEKIIDNIVLLVKSLLEEACLDVKNIIGIGLGVPGIIDCENGVVVCSHNLNLYNFDIVKKLQDKINIKVKIINDANAFTLAEYNFGKGKNCNNLVVLTLGTGVGGGAIIDGNLLVGNNSSGAEFGHMVIEFNGIRCSCGRYGCLEQYVSATSLKNNTIIAMKNNPNSKLWEANFLENVTAKTAFDYKDIDETANKVINEYINYLACGLINIANIFRPEMIILAGGISKQGEVLTKPLQSILNKSIFASELTPKVKVETSDLGDKLGVLGAVCNFLIK